MTTGVVKPQSFTENAQTILCMRYLHQHQWEDENSKCKVCGTYPGGAKGDGPFDNHKVCEHCAEMHESENQFLDRISFGVPEFRELIASHRFFPNSPTMFNAGLRGNLSACFVLGLDDSLDSIIACGSAQMRTLQWGGGTGVSLSKLRAKGQPIGGVHGHACGPVSVLQTMNQNSRMVAQNGVRQGANMAVLRFDHPDIEEFITCKNDDPDSISDFNISVGTTDGFWKCVEEDTEFAVIDHKGAMVGQKSARRILRMIAEGVHRTGDPGVVNLTRVNEDNPLIEVYGEIEATNPCGEQPLLPWESCNLGHLNLLAYVGADEPLTNLFGWKSFDRDVETAVRYLDRVVTENSFPVPEQKKMNEETRRVGVGVMGLHDALIAMSIPYASDEGVEMSERLAEALEIATDRESLQLGKALGPYGAWEEGQGPKYRNAWRRTVAPTGTTSIIAGVSGGIEPWFSMHHERRTAEGVVLEEVNRDLYNEVRARGARITEEDLFTRLRAGEPLGKIEEVPEEVRELFATAMEIQPRWHLDHQQAWQGHVDSAISKTINLPADAVVAEIEMMFKLAMIQRSLKGVTMYRDGSRDNQVLSHTAAAQPAATLQLGVHSGDHPEHVHGRKRLSEERHALTHKFAINGLDGYITVGLYDEGSPGEIFIKIAKEGETISGLLDAWAVTTSIALQYGTPLESLLVKWEGTRFDPSGFTESKAIRKCTSIIDYLAQWLRMKFIDNTTGETKRESGDLCSRCGAMVVYQEGCLKCTSSTCGWSEC